MQEYIFLIFVGCSFIFFRYLQPVIAATLIFFGGWLLLPVANYEKILPDTFYTSEEYTLPSHVLSIVFYQGTFLTKGMITALAAWFGLLLNKPRLVTIKLSNFDFCALLFCLLPVFASFYHNTNLEKHALQSLYFMCVLLTPWIFGKMLIKNERDLKLVTQTILWITFIMIPLAFLESLKGPFLYDFLYEPHPFSGDGGIRLVYYRPMLFFEHGNQLGIWFGTTALLALGLYEQERSIKTLLVAILFAAFLMIFQSKGAIILFGIAALPLLLHKRVPSRLMLFILSVLSFFSLAIPILGGSTLREWIKTSVAFPYLKNFFWNIGGNSLLWRIDQDFANADTLSQNLYFGQGTPYWWCANAEGRPWGLHMLVIGAYGLLGFILWSFWLLSPVIATLKRKRLSPLITTITLCIVINWIDGLVNSFFIFPIILFSGALCNDLTNNEVTI